MLLSRRIAPLSIRHGLSQLSFIRLPGAWNRTSKAHVSTNSGPRVPNTILVSVPQESAYIVERFGRYTRTLTPGLAILLPFIDRISYSKTLKEVAMPIPPQTAITMDNITLEIDGVIYTKITDARKAAYGVEDADFAIQQLIQTTMRNQVSSMTLEQVLQSRSTLANKILSVVNEAAEAWGVKCLRYEIRDVVPPRNVLLAMQRAAVDKLFG